jgi:hypothetical protein
MMTSQHKYLIAGLLLGMAVFYVWQRRSSHGSEG